MSNAFNWNDGTPSIMRPTKRELTAEKVRQRKLLLDTAAFRQPFRLIPLPNEITTTTPVAGRDSSDGDTAPAGHDICAE